MSVPIAAYLFPEVSAQTCCCLAAPTILSLHKADQPPIFSGSPYLKRTLSPSTQRPSASAGVDCLSNPGAILTFAKGMANYTIKMFLF